MRLGGSPDGGRLPPLAVLFDAIFGPDFVSTSNDGNATTIPSAILLALFAYLGTRVVAKSGFGNPQDQPR